jgi:hypothetical protein
MARVIKNNWWAQMACQSDDEKRYFQDEKQRDLWTKLHKKKCEICMISIIKHIGETNYTFNVNTNTGLVFHQQQATERQDAQVALMRVMLN